MPLGFLKVFDIIPGWVYAAALAVALITATAMGHAWLGARDDLARQGEQMTNTTNAATACSDSIDKLLLVSQRRKAEDAPKIAAAAASAAAGDKRADEILAAAPADPADDCKSAQAQVDKWLQGRAP